jgi:LuxR family maltose regulon positive regulatory protein
LTVTSAYLVDGDLSPATERFVEATVASMHGQHPFPTTLRSMTNLARLQVLQGRLRQAASTLEQMMHLASGHGELQGLLNGVDYYFLLGELLREWNQLEQAEQHLEDGMDLDSGMLTAEAEMITRGYLALARLQQARGQSMLARETLDAFALLAQQRSFAPALLAHGAAIRTQLALAQGDLPAAIRWAEQSGLSATDALSYPHEREYLTLARVRIAQGREQPTGPFLSQALALLERLLEDAEPKARMSSVIEILLLRTLALDAQNNHEQALQTLARALEVAEPEGYIRLFLDEGAPMLALLRQAFRRQATPEYVATLFEAASEPTTRKIDRSSLNASTLAEPLTDREREVQRLLMGGASNREIAQHLVLSVNTAKKHVLNICGKLGVKSRTQAIARASSLKFL